MVRPRLFPKHHISAETEWASKTPAESDSDVSQGDPGAPIEVVADAIRDTIGRYYTTANDGGVPWDEGEYVFPVLDTSDVVADLDAIVDWRVHEATVDLLDDEAWVRTHDPAPSRSQLLRRGWDRFREHVEHTSRFLIAPPDETSEYEPSPDYGPADLLAEIGKTIVALDLVTTIAEEVYDGRDHVPTATFLPTFELAVVDLTRVPPLSVFNPSVDPDDAERAAFLHGFVREITRPITRDDRVNHEYTPTQLLPTGVVHPGPSSARSSFLLGDPVAVPDPRAGSRALTVATAWRAPGRTTSRHE